MHVGLKIRLSLYFTVFFKFDAKYIRINCLFER